MEYQFQSSHEEQDMTLDGTKGHIEQSAKYILMNQRIHFHD